jgi:hypothetical protein
MELIKHRRDLGKIINLSLPAAEIGVAEGYFAADILSWGVPKLYMVDNWGYLQVSGDGANPQTWHEKNYNDAVNRVKKYGDKARILRGISWDMGGHVQDESLGFVNIDCDHSYEGVKKDIVAWWPKLVKGGVMAFHDYENKSYGVKRAVEEFAHGKYEIHLLPEDKVEDAGAYIIKK